METMKKTIQVGEVELVINDVVGFLEKHFEKEIDAMLMDGTLTEKDIDEDYITSKFSSDEILEMVDKSDLESKCDSEFCGSCDEVCNEDTCEYVLASQEEGTSLMEDFNHGDFDLVAFLKELKEAELVEVLNQLRKD